MGIYAFSEIEKKKKYNHKEISERSQKNNKIFATHWSIIPTAVAACYISIIQYGGEKKIKRHPIPPRCLFNKQ